MKLQEIHGASKRNEIEIALFNMHFFSKLNNETQEKLNRIIEL